MTILFNFLLITLVVMAAAVVFTHKLRVAVVIFGIYSMVAAFVYLFLAAPDVALAEAVIGSTLATVIFLTGIQKYRVCTICALPSDAKMEAKMRAIVHRCAARKELEPNLQSVSTFKELEAQFYDLGYELGEHRIRLYGETDSYFIADIRAELEAVFPGVPLTVTSPGNGQN